MAFLCIYVRDLTTKTRGVVDTRHGRIYLKKSKNLKIPKKIKLNEIKLKIKKRSSFTAIANTYTRHCEEHYFRHQGKVIHTYMCIYTNQVTHCRWSNLGILLFLFKPVTTDNCDKLHHLYRHAKG